MPEEYGVLTPRWLRGWIGTLTDVSGVVATLLGFAGAQHQCSEDRPLLKGGVND